MFCFFIPSDKLYLVGVREESKPIMQKVLFLALLPKTKDLCFLTLYSRELGDMKVWERQSVGLEPATLQRSRALKGSVEEMTSQRDLAVLLSWAKTT